MSSIRSFTFGRFWRTTFETFWKPMSPIPPSPPMAQAFGSSATSRSVMRASVKWARSKYSAAVRAAVVAARRASASRSGMTERRAWSWTNASPKSQATVAPSWKREFIHG